MSVSISFRNTTKKYGDFTVIPNLSLRIEKGEFFTLLGPSGCGKTTLLRMVAGFVSIESGKIYFNEKAINDEPPGNRNIGMVFQDYALFPHLTVRENVAFGLKNRRIPRAKIYEMVDETLEIVKIAEHSDKLPERLSGGQQQRVALARAIIIQPSVLLMDEPLSNLDAMLRIEMRNAIKELQNELGITTIYVTHDQEEAMAISDRIGIMDSGVIQQIGTPREIYQKPENLFVANFIGQTNVLDGALTCDRGDVILEFTDSYRVTMNDVNIAYEKGKKMPVKISVRPEDFTIGRNGDGMEA
ncbi:MAG: ABC transporter ATP-binding protein, partial [Firmicutes bacterium]|nr:ABC transporter ATP-binding protein [Bacillota bacterium]